VGLRAIMTCIATNEVMHLVRYDAPQEVAAWQRRTRASQSPYVLKFMRSCAASLAWLKRANRPSLETF
jgi:hypothetical protein